MEWIGLWFILSVVAGVIASAKGRSGLLIFLLSLVLSPLIGILVALLMASSEANDREAARDGTSSGFRVCPMCAETVRKEALRCRYCQADLSATANGESTDESTTRKLAEALARQSHSRPL